jgi:hypothetical protein
MHGFCTGGGIVKARGAAQVRADMTATIAANRHRWWVVIEYEVSMLRGLRGLQTVKGWVNAPSSEHDLRRTGWLLAMSVAEGRVLHTRNLCDFCTSTKTNDIKPHDLFENYDTDPKYDTLKGLMKEIAERYGQNKDGDARWAFNKMLAHPTQERDESFDYTPFLDRVLPVLEEIIGEIETLRDTPFPSFPKS